MESAPSSEHVQVITYLHQKGFDYSSERALVEACKDLKIFVNILKELTDDIQPNFTKAWLAVEGYSFTTDVQRNRNSLPVLNEFLAIGQILEKLGIKLRISDFYSKRICDGKMVIPILNRVVKFLEARSAMVRNQASQRVSHHKSLMIYKASAQSLSQSESKYQEVKNQKEKEKAQVEERYRIDHQLKDKNQNLHNVYRRLLRVYEQGAEQLKMLEKKRVENEMEIQNKNIKISQIKRQLVKLAPDIKRQKQNMELKINDLQNKCQYTERAWKNISEQSQSTNLMLGAHQQKFRQWLEFSKQELQKNAKQNTELSIQQMKKNELSSLINKTGNQIKKIIEENTKNQQVIRHNQTNLRQLDRQVKQTEFQIRQKKAIKQQAEHQIIGCQNFRTIVDRERQKVLMKASLKFEQFEKIMEEHYTMVQTFLGEIVAKYASIEE